MASLPYRSSRTRKPSIRKKPVSPSLTSLFSSVTQTSNGSSGSNSTVTPESVSRSRQRSSRQGVSKKGSSTGQPSRKSRKSPSMSPVEERPNVFSFMEEDEDNVTKPEERAELEGRGIAQPLHLQTGPPFLNVAPYPVQMVPAYRSPPGDYHQSWDNISLPSGSFHSDSGISVRSNSPATNSTSAHQKGAASSTQTKKARESPRRASQSSDASHASSSRAPRSLEDASDVSPEAFYSGASRHQYPNLEFEASNGQVPPNHSPPSQSKRQDSANHSDRSGYDLLASKLSSYSDEPLVPIYRKFETLNNRILLYLQDEISELEEDLKGIDAVIAKADKATGAEVTSRRLEAKMPSPLQWQRMEILGRIMVKMDQYNRALSSYSSLSKSLDPVYDIDINAYKDWLASAASIASNETAFLDHDDLATIPPPRSTNPVMSDKSAIVSIIAVLITIITFKLVPEFFSRMVIGVLIVSALCYSQLSSEGLGGDWLSENGRRLAVYGAAIFILALAVG